MKVKWVHAISPPDPGGQRNAHFLTYSCLQTLCNLGVGKGWTRHPKEAGGAMPCDECIWRMWNALGLPPPSPRPELAQRVTIGKSLRARCAAPQCGAHIGGPILASRSPRTCVVVAGRFYEMRCWDDVMGIPKPGEKD